MIAVVVALVVPLVLGEAGAARSHSELEARNALRARAGLLPRKPPPRSRAPRGVRLLPASAHEPGFLPEPAPLAGSPAEYGPGPDGDPALQVAATGLRARVRIVVR